MTKYHFLLSGMLILSIPLRPFPGAYININPGNQSSEPIYHLAFANFGPLNDDIFIADADGNHARPLLPNPANDYNASFRMMVNGSYLHQNEMVQQIFIVHIPMDR